MQKIWRALIFNQIQPLVATNRKIDLKTAATSVTMRVTTDLWLSAVGCQVDCSTAGARQGGGVQCGYNIGIWEFCHPPPPPFFFLMTSLVIQRLLF